MFRLTEPPSGQIKNIVLVYSVSANIMGSHTVYGCTHHGIPYCLWVHTLWDPILFMGAQIMGSHIVYGCTHYGIPYCLWVHTLWDPIMCTHWTYQHYILYLAWWWLSEPKHVAEFLILITNICCVYWLNKLLYYCKTQPDGCCYQKTEIPLTVSVQCSVCDTARHGTARHIASRHLNNS
jgi:hypothetical protein